MERAEGATTLEPQRHMLAPDVTPGKTKSAEPEPRQLRHGELILSLPEIQHEAGNMGKVTFPSGKFALCAVFKGGGPDRFSDGEKTTGLAKSISAQPHAFVHCRDAGANFRRQTRN